MGLMCICPQGEALQSIPLSDCPETFGQTQKVAFQRLTNAAGVKNVFAAAALPTLKASWTPLLTAEDGTKVTVSPYLSEPVLEPGAKRTYGGGNATLGGIPEIIGREPSAFTSKLLKVQQATVKALKAYQCENVGVFLIDEYGAIGCLCDNPAAPTKYFPIPVRGFFIGDKALGGLEGIDANAMDFSFMPNWSDNFTIVKPTDFDALTDLNVAP